MAFKMNITLPLAETWMCLEMTVLSKVSQKEKDKYHMMSLNVDSEKTNKHTKQ